MRVRFYRLRILAFVFLMIPVSIGLFLYTREALAEDSQFEQGTSYIINTVAGNGTAGFSGDNEPAASAQLNQPYGIAVDGADNLYIADFTNSRVRRIDKDGRITTIAGTGDAGYSGDNGPAASAQLYFPSYVAVDGAGNVYIADSVNRRIRKVDPNGIITTVAGNGGDGYSGDNIPAVSTELGYMSGIAVDNVGNIFIAEELNNRIRKVDASGIITTVAGTGVGGYSGDNGPATSSQLYYPSGLAVDGVGNLYILDEGNNRVRKIDLNATITTVAGMGWPGHSGDNGPATSATMDGLSGIAVDGAGNLYLAEWLQYIRKVDSDGIITTIGGNGTIGYSGDGGPATSAALNYPTGVAVTNDGKVYISDTYNSLIRLLSPVINISPADLPEADQGMTYNISLTASGGKQPYIWSIDGGSLPIGLTLSESGLISGTPTMNGDFSFTVRVTDSASPVSSATANYSLKVIAPLVITSADLPSWRVGVTYNLTLEVNGGIAPYSWSASGLPAGVYLGSDGNLSGTPQAAGSFIVDIIVKDSVNGNTHGSFTLLIKPESLLGDLNDDGQINIVDLVQLAKSYGTAGNPISDLNKDGIIDLYDLVLLSKKFNFK